MNVQRLFSIIRKETAQLLRDRRTLGTIITLPIIQMVLYGYLSNEVLHQPTAVWDQSQTAESRALVAVFENTRYFSVRYWAGNLGEIERRLDAGQVKVGLVIPPDYAQRLRAAEPVQVMVVVDASDATSARVILSVAGGVGASISRDAGISQLARAGLRSPPSAAPGFSGPSPAPSSEPRRLRSSSCCPAYPSPGSCSRGSRCPRCSTGWATRCR